MHSISHNLTPRPGARFQIIRMSLRVRIHSWHNQSVWSHRGDNIRCTPIDPDGIGSMTPEYTTPRLNSRHEQSCRGARSRLQVSVPAQGTGIGALDVGAGRPWLARSIFIARKDNMSKGALGDPSCA